MNTIEEALEAKALLSEYRQNHKFKTRNWVALGVSLASEAEEDRQYSLYVSIEESANFSKEQIKVSDAAEKVGAMSLVDTIDYRQTTTPIAY